MATSDLWTGVQIEAMVRRELMDPTGTTAWSWNTAEIQLYINDWQNLLQDRFEMVWGSSTYIVTGGTSTITLTNVASNMLRLGNIWWNGYRLAGRDKEEIEILERDWRAAQPGVPEAVYQDDINSVSLWPTPDPTSGTTTDGTSTNTMVFEFPVVTTFNTNTDTMSIPAWTKYSAVNYVCYRAYMRPGPQQDLNRSQRYRAKFVKQGIRIRTMWDQYLPDKPPSLRFGKRYEAGILTVGAHSNLFTTWF
jgi:hypothetical protein